MSTLTIRVENITITIESSETAKISTVEAKAYKTQAMVDDNSLNRGNTFWGPLIGQVVEVLSTEPDGLLLVQLPDHMLPVQGVEPTRLINIP